MPHVRIEHAVPDFAAWKQLFDSDPADRKGSGVRRYQIFRARDDANVVMIDLEFDRIEAAEAFVDALERLWQGPAKAIMQNPRARIVDRVESAEL